VIKYRTLYKSEGKQLIGGVVFEDGEVTLNDEEGKLVENVLTTFYGCERVAAEVEVKDEKPVADNSLKAAATKSPAK